MKEELQNLINELKTEELSDVKKSEILMNLTQEIEVLENSFNETNSNLEKVKKERDDYAILNNKLFLQRNQSDVEITENNSNENVETDFDSNLTFENLQKEFD